MPVTCIIHNNKNNISLYSGSMSSSTQKALLSATLLLGTGITGAFAQTKSEMKLSNLLTPPKGISVTITPPEAPSTAPGRHTIVDYFLESTTEPGMVRTLHIDAVDGQNGNPPDSIISLYDIQSFEFTEINSRGMTRTIGTYSPTENDYEVSINDGSSVETFPTNSMYSISTIRDFLKMRDTRKQKSEFRP